MAAKYGLSLDPQGGDGYEARRDPNPHCSEGAGNGLTIHRVADTRNLSPGARALYRGAKVPKEGIEILIANQEAVGGTLVKHYGIAVARKRIIVRKFDPDELSRRSWSSRSPNWKYSIMRSPTLSSRTYRGNNRRLNQSRN
jgi:hypothetical protein